VAKQGQVYKCKLLSRLGAVLLIEQRTIKMLHYAKAAATTAAPRKAEWTSFQQRPYNTWRHAVLPVHA
jgi:hypothetical protein